VWRYSSGGAMKDFYEWLLENNNAVFHNFFAQIRHYVHAEHGIFIYGVGGGENRDGYQWLYGTRD
jgi:hypothetical protein